MAVSIMHQVLNLLVLLLILEVHVEPCAADQCPFLNTSAIAKPLSANTALRYLPQPVSEHPGVPGLPLLIPALTLRARRGAANNGSSGLADGETLISAIRVAGPTALRLDSFDVSYRGGQTWQNLESFLLHTVKGFPDGCMGLFGLPERITVSPSQEYLVLLDFPRGPCEDLVLVYRLREKLLLSVNTSLVRAPRALRPGMTSLPGPSPDSFRIASYGGSQCDSGQVDACFNFSSGVWLLDMDLARPNVMLSWREVDVRSSASAVTPGPRAGSHLFGTDSHLLLYGGVQRDQTSFVLRCDFWAFDFLSRQWTALSSNFACENLRLLTSEVLSALSWSKAAYLSSASQILITRTDPRTKNVYLVICNLRLEDHHVQCTNETLTAANPNTIGDWYELVAGSRAFYLVRTDREESYEVTLSVTASQPSSITPILRPLSSEIERPGFSGFQGCVGSAVLGMTGGRTIMIFGGQCPFQQFRAQIGDGLRPPGMPIWILSTLTNPFMTAVFPYTLSHPHPGPRLPLRQGHTVVSNRYFAILYGGKEYENNNDFHMDASPWCYDMYHETWMESTVSPTYDAIGPEARHGHVAFAHSFGRNATGFVIQGGQVPSPGDGAVTGIVGDLWFFAWSELLECTGRWYDLTAKAVGSPLPCRTLHSLTQFTGRIILFGGEVGQCTPQHDHTPRQAHDQEDDWDFDSFLTVLTLHSLDHIGVSRVHLAKPMRRRISHTLTQYTNSDLLLLGGRYGLAPGQSAIEFAQDALLLRLPPSLWEQDGVKLTYTNSTVETVPFFNISLFGHRTVGSYLFSGLVPPQDGNQRSNFLALSYSGACPKGYERSRNNTCQPCPQGYFSPDVLSPCVQCGVLLTTVGTGSSNCTAYDPCYTRFCHGNGVCLVRSNAQAYCKCNFGYLPDDNCRLPLVYLYVLAATGSSTLTTLLATALVQYIRKRRILRRTEEERQQLGRALAQSNRKLANVNEGATIKWSDLVIDQCELARSRSSVLYRAKWTDLDVVVKKFTATSKQSISLQQESPCDIFVREAETLRSLRHPNIVMFLGAGMDTTSRRPFLVMEYLVRGSLARILQDNSERIEQSDRVRFALDAARGMAYLHGLEYPRVHRDIKSSNLLVSEKWVVKVGDLETARLLEEFLANTDQPRQSTQYGSMDNAAPPRDQDQQEEQQDVEASGETQRLLQGRSSRAQSRHQVACIQPDNHRVRQMTTGTGTDRWRSPESITKNQRTTKGDVYSFGVVLYELASRQLPYADLESTEAILDQITEGEPPGAMPLGLPYAYCRLAERCMKSSPTERPTFQDIVTDLERQKLDLA
ncbi:uncharacterized protein LOC135819272 [Sycon ciliatum]|uniref:uncharacterized protein LOC135819272 n=1 Tax=Sycon ciliatum TaxID=27933 RepID=UPI0031F68F3F